MLIKFKWSLIFLAVAVISGIFAFSDIFAKTSDIAQGISIIALVLFLFFAVAHALRGEKHDRTNKTQPQQRR